MKPTTKSVDDVIADIEAQQRDEDHPRSIARQRIKEWRSNAQRQSLPVTNVHDDKGAKVLPVDEVLGHGEHDRRLGRK